MHLFFIVNFLYSHFINNKLTTTDKILLLCLTADFPTPTARD